MRRASPVSVVVRDFNSVQARTQPRPTGGVSLEFFDEEVRELDRVAVVLEGDRAARRHAGQLGVLDHRLAVQDDRQPVALHGDDEAVPLAERLVGLALSA